MGKDSIPGNNEGVQDEHSLPQNPADTTDESQSSNEEDNGFFSYESTDEENEDAEDDAPSQSQNDEDDTTNEESEEENSEEEDSKVDPDLAKWANSQNISLETETEINLAKRLRDTQKSLHETKAESKKKFTEATNDPTDPVAKRLEAKLARMDFFESTPDARELEGVMYDIAIEAKESGDTAGFAYYQTPNGWKTLYKIAKANQAEVQSEDSYTAGRTDERKNLAKKQQASTTKANANNSAPTDSRVTDDTVAKMSPAEYDAFRREHPEWNPFG